MMINGDVRSGWNPASLCQLDKVDKADKNKLDLDYDHGKSVNDVLTLTISLSYSRTGIGQLFFSLQIRRLQDIVRKHAT